MPTIDPRVDAYINKSAPFARPILEYVRAVVHDALPDVEETIKWGFPHFTHNGMLCAMSAFKAHCAFGFWRGAQVVEGAVGGSMGDFGKITSVADLPGKRALAAMVRKAAALNAVGEPTPVATSRAKKVAAAGGRKVVVPALPADFAAALRKVRGAMAQFDAMSPSHRKEYLLWITEAKKDETRARRIEKAVGMIAEGKSQNSKYER
jgi:uncharacterized protein YdeI (YjbR/CyaY-like superfamily)